MQTKPTLETFIGLYRAALDQEHNSQLATQRIVECANRHGYTPEQLRSPKFNLSTDYRAKILKAM